MSIKVLYWNVWCLPKIATDGNHTITERAKLVRQHLAGYDVVILNEAWVWSKDEFKKTYAYHYSPPKGLSIGDSGLMILSNNPITNTDYIRYSKSAGFDWFAEKSAAYCEITINGIVHNFIFTHMQAGYSKCDQTARVSQTNELINFVNSKPKTARTYMIGDFNIMPIVPGMLISGHAHDQADAVARDACYQKLVSATSFKDSQTGPSIRDVYHYFTYRSTPIMIKTGILIRDSKGRPLTDSSHIILTI